MSQTAAPFVHTGPWINWSHGIVLGSTITLSERNGELLTAFLAMFVTAAGAASWKIMSFALHQHRSPRDPQDGVHHQQQAILRNTDSPFGASLELAKLFWYWRKLALRPFLRTLPLVALALFNFLLFGTYTIEGTLPIGYPICGARIIWRSKGSPHDLRVILCRVLYLHRTMLTPRSTQALLVSFPQKLPKQPEMRP